jgi:endonuclease YncB( thermonuclease family)
MARKERVTRVIDGDTFETANRKRSIRLANVDAPEKGKKGGAKATQSLRNLIAGETVSVETVARDKYGRSVAKVKVGRKSVNKAMRERTRKK